MITSGLQVESSFKSLGIELSLFRGAVRATDRTEFICWDLNSEVHITYFISFESKILNIVCYDNFLSADCFDGLSEQVFQAADFLLKTMRSLIEKNCTEFHEKNTAYNKILRDLGCINAAWEDKKPY